MTLRNPIYWILAAAVVLAGCDRIAGPGEPQANWSRIALDERVTDAYTDFGFELFRTLRAVEPSENVFVSPTSAAFALAMTYNGAVGQTADEMALALGVGHLDLVTLNETNRAWLAALRETGDPRAELAVANSVWYRESRPILDSFRETVASYYGAEIEPITTAAAINAWVDGATRGRIDEIVEGAIPGNVVAYLINAVYFKADWTYQFDEADTRDTPFHRLDGSTVEVPMMFQEAELETRFDSEMRMVRLPYGSGRFSMILALPNEGRTLTSVAERLDAGRWQEWMSEFSEASVIRIGVPRFEVEWESSLVESLQAMGMEVPFSAGAADFSAMFEGGGPWIDEVLQKTYLKVDEKGTEAAAVTSVAMIESAGGGGLVFDRPFFLAIYDHATETVLFLGQITDPSGAASG